MGWWSRNGRVGMAVLACSLALPALAAEEPARAARGQVVTSEGAWAPQLPNGWVVGDISAVAVDRRDNVYVLHRPASVKDRDRASVAPPVLVFDPNGRFLRGFGGPGAGYEWPTTEHSLDVDGKGRVWIGGSSRAKPASDDMILVFDGLGRFLRQIGRRGGNGGNGDTRNFGSPADIFVDDARREVYVADGYANRRLIVLDSETGAFKRMWSAFGAPPPAEPAPSPRAPGAPFTEVHDDGPAGFNGVHGVEVSRDGVVYVADRWNQRIQLFTRAGRYLGQIFVDRNYPSPQTASGMALSSDRGQKYLVVSDMGNNQILVYDRARRELVQRLTDDVRGPHLIAGDSRGNVYVTEVALRRITRLNLKQR